MAATRPKKKNPTCQPGWHALDADPRLGPTFDHGTRWLQPGVVEARLVCVLCGVEVHRVHEAGGERRCWEREYPPTSGPTAPDRRWPGEF